MSVMAWYARVKRICLTRRTRSCWNALGGLHQLRTVVQKRQYVVGLSWWQVEDQASNPGIAIALNQLLVLGHAEDRNRDSRRVAPCLRGHFLEVGQQIQHITIRWTAGVWHPAIAIGDGAACPIRIRTADDHRRVGLLDRLRPRHHGRE